MTTPELMRAFDKWCSLVDQTDQPGGWAGYADVYPLYIGHPMHGTWYVRERLSGTRVWRAEEDGSFVLLSVEDLALAARQADEAEARRVAKERHCDLMRQGFWHALGSRIRRRR